LKDNKRLLPFDDRMDHPKVSASRETASLIAINCCVTVAAPTAHWSPAQKGERLVQLLPAEVLE